MATPQEINTIFNTLGRIEAAVDAVRENQRDVKEALEKDTSRLEGRVDKHERDIIAVHQKIHWFSGAATMVGLIVGWIGKSTLTGNNPL